MSKKNHPRGAHAPLVGSQITVTIEKLAIGGAGIARHDGFVYFIADTAPGEEVLIEVALVKKNFAEGRVLKIIKASPERRTPPCPVAPQCGGCNWQHLTETEQQKQKEKLVFETLRKFNPLLEFEYLPLKPSPRSLRYRNRIQPKFKNGSFGFFSRSSHNIVEVSDCLITEEALTSAIPEVQKWITKQNPKGLQRLEMYISDENKIRYGLITDDDDGIGFSQVNRFQNEDLLITTLEWAGNNSYRNVFDLYAGSGNFTFPLAQAYPSSPITAVELSEKLVLRGNEKNTLSQQVRFIQSDVEAYIKKAKIGPQDLIVLDPPRAGASELIMKTLAQSGPQKIIYISCHPVSLARDLSWFFKWAKEFGRNAKLARVQAFEMFPQTDHVETIAELRVDS